MYDYILCVYIYTHKSNIDIYTERERPHIILMPLHLFSYLASSHRLPVALRHLRSFLGDCCLYAFAVVESDWTATGNGGWKMPPMREKDEHHKHLVGF